MVKNLKEWVTFRTCRRIGPPTRVCSEGESVGCVVLEVVDGASPLRRHIDIVDPVCGGGTVTVVVKVVSQSGHITVTM